MTDDTDVRQLQRAVREALGSDAPIDLDRDLWPRMHERLAAPAPAPSRLDWALLAAVAGAAAAFPNVLLGALYTL